MPKAGWQNLLVLHASLAGKRKLRLRLNTKALPSTGLDPTIPDPKVLSVPSHV